MEHMLKCPSIKDPVVALVEFPGYRGVEVVDQIGSLIGSGIHGVHPSKAKTLEQGLGKVAIGALVIGKLTQVDAMALAQPGGLALLEPQPLAPKHEHIGRLRCEAAGEHEQFSAYRIDGHEAGD